jgi:hypothetical protein
VCNDIDRKLGRTAFNRRLPQPLSIDLSAMTDPQHQDDQFIVLDVVDDSEVADANAELAVTTF